MLLVPGASIARVLRYEDVISPEVVEAECVALQEFREAYAQKGCLEPGAECEDSTTYIQARMAFFRLDLNQNDVVETSELNPYTEAFVTAVLNDSAYNETTATEHRELQTFIRDGFEKMVMDGPTGVRYLSTLQGADESIRYVKEGLSGV